LMDNTDKNKYDITPIYISRDGTWFTGDKLRDIKTYENFNESASNLNRCHISPVPGQGLIVSSKGTFCEKTRQVLLDAVIPAMHGMHGEDGTVQGLLELADIPYASPGVVGSAVGMDKIVMKAFFKGNGFPVLESCQFERLEWEKDRGRIVEVIEKTLTYPVFIKPANLGSSIGISKATDRQSLENGIEIAVSFDRRVLVEQAATDIIELNCSCLGFGSDARASAVEQPAGWEEFLTFDDKYMRSDSGKGMQALSRRVPAPIDEQLKLEIENLSMDIFKALDCKGVVRIDYLYSKSQGKLYVNEINTIPGSFAFYLWDVLGLPFAKLIDEIIAYACIAQEEKRKNNYAYTSGILKKAGRGTKGIKGMKA
jgi:D-alanine-D-alanine ligase